MKKSILFVIILCVAGLTGCGGTTTIEEITKDPDKFIHRECLVSGRVTKVIDVPFVQEDFFKIHDTTGEIWIYTKKGVPPKNINVEVKGIFIRLIDAPFIHSLLEKVHVDVGFCIKLETLDF